MGMLFNTRGTLALLKILNDHFGARNFQGARNRNEHSVLRGASSSRDAAHQLNLEHPTDSALNLRWKKWLDYLDDYSQGGVSGGHLVRQAMADAIDQRSNANCNAIEFFAVPGPGFHVFVPPPQIKDPDNPGQYSIEIVVQTQIIDEIISAHRHRTPKKPKRSK